MGHWEYSDLYTSQLRRANRAAAIKAWCSHCRMDTEIVAYKHTVKDLIACVCAECLGCEPLKEAA